VCASGLTKPKAIGVWEDDAQNLAAALFSGDEADWHGQDASVPPVCLEPSSTADGLADHVEQGLTLFIAGVPPDLEIGMVEAFPDAVHVCEWCVGNEHRWPSRASR